MAKDRGARRLLVLLLVSLPGAASGATITVTEAADALHTSGCAASGTGECTLRDAITFANSRRGKDTIQIVIGSGPARITLTSPLPAITDPVTLDATTQPGYAGAPLVVLDGSGAGDGAVGLRVTAGATTVKGLAVCRFHPADAGAIVIAEKGGNVLQGNFVGVDPSGGAEAGNAGHGILVRSNGNTIGGTEAGQGNVVSGNAGDGIRIQGARNVVVGNRIGTDPSGERAVGNRGDGIVAAGGNTVGGSNARARNLISGNGGAGISAGPTEAIAGNYVGTDVSGASAIGNSRAGIQGGGRIGGTEGTHQSGPCMGACNLVSGNGGAGISPSEGAVVEGNFVGTDAPGTSAVPNRQAGISVQRVARVTVGGSSTPARNLVSGNLGPGVEIAFDAEDARVLGNLIGVDATAAQPLGNGVGVVVRDGAKQNLIGGDASTEGNRIAYNGGAGVSVEPSAGGANTIRGNAIFENGGLGIDLGGAGASAASASESGAPAGVPVLTRVTPYSVEGTLDAAPSTGYIMELFASPACDPSGSGEGESMIALTAFSTDAAGHAGFGVSLTAPPGQVVTATATDSVGNTSEFSVCVPVEPPAD